MMSDYDSYGNTPSIAPSTADVNAMKKVLEAFSNAGNTVLTEMANEATYDPEISDLYNTAMTGKVMIGNIFEVRIREIESLRGKKKVYDIFNTATNECISDDLFLYEAAYAIVKYLNKGHNLLSSEIRNIARLEQDYASMRTDAGMFRIRLSENLQKGNRQKAQLYETRFNDTRDKALAIKAEIIKIAEKL